ncbi:MAG: hypothetical protein RLZZ292_197 [Bacteroidota bacterium]|jgi:hypothetical protein
MPTIFTLQVAINQYHPQSTVLSLDGCVKDIEATAAYFSTTFSALKFDENVVQLKNEVATKENIIHEFEQHLCQNSKIKAGDLVLFQYSGHGSTDATSPEFMLSDGKRQDETIVCYDSRLPGNYDLSDKELATLLSKVRPDVQVIVLLDCCHSGSGTRSVYANKARLAEKRSGLTRGLDQYYDYKNLTRNDTGKIAIPQRPHLLLAACDRDELANEHEGQGLFTFTLLETLKASAVRMSYANLFSSLTVMMRRYADDQTPQIEAVGTFNANTYFLGTSIENTNKFEVAYNETGQTGFWKMSNFGAIHGAEENLNISLLPISNPNGEEIIVAISEVQMDYSILDFQGADTSLRYEGEVISIRKNIALPVLLLGEDTLKNAFFKTYNSNPSPYLSFVKENEANSATYIVELATQESCVKQKASGKRIFTTDVKGENTNKKIIETLTQLERWERFSKLNNPKTTLSSDAVEVNFIEEDNKKRIFSFDLEKITMDYPFKDDTGNLSYMITVSNKKDRDLYVGLLRFGEDYSIHLIYQNVLPEGASNIALFNERENLFITNNAANSETDIFKLIISTQPLVLSAFPQAAIEKEPTRGSRQQSALRPPAQDWAIKTLHVETVRTFQKINNKTTVIDNNLVTIEGNGQMEASVTFKPLGGGTRGVDAENKFQRLFNAHNLSILPLQAGRTRGLDSNSIIELRDIKNEASLADNPLKITLKQALADGEHIVPVTFFKEGNEEFILPFGAITRNDEGHTVVTITNLPSQTEGKSENGEQKRSLTRALKFCFLKVTLPKSDIYQLRAVDYSSGKPVKTKEGLEAKVAAATKILICVHGIIGDTEGIVGNLNYLLETKQFDLILTFDYENLNTKIEDIALEFKKCLEKAGINASDNKHTDIIAHSMGGLVSRYLIENHYAGNAPIDHLIMFGTPNGGSDFGSVPGYLKKFNLLFGIGLNYFKNSLGLIGQALDILHKGTTALDKYALTTLAQMATDSDFIKTLALNPAPRSTEYTIVAGDTSEYQPFVAGTFGRLIDKLETFVGNSVYGKDTPNDIAVSSDNILNVPHLTDDSKKRTVSCHHLNYFEIGSEGFEELKKVV